MPGPRKKHGRTPAKSPSSRESHEQVLEKLENHESAAVLRVLLAKHPELREEAARRATDLINCPSVEEIAEDVYCAVTSVDIDEIDDRSGNHSYGYVGPSAASDELLEEAIEGFTSDMRRQLQLGMFESAETICRGIVTGLYRAANEPSGAGLGWSPDFPHEAAAEAIQEHVEKYPKDGRKESVERLLGSLSSDVPGWGKKLSAWLLSR